MNQLRPIFFSQKKLSGAPLALEASQQRISAKDLSDQMSSKQDEQRQRQLYRSLSRKELQTWCKKLGLPARKSSSVMAESLLSYFQQNGIDLATSGKSFSKYPEVLPPTSLVPSHCPAVPLYMTEHAFQGCMPRYCHADEGDKGNGIDHQSKLEAFRGHQFSDQGGLGSISNSFLEASQPLPVSQRAGCGFSHEESLHLSRRFEDVPQSDCIAIDGGAITRTEGRPTKGPGSFEFYVGSEEGIKLSVDLSSRTLEWIKNYGSQVYSLDNLHKSHSLRQDLGCVGESSKQRLSVPLGSVELRPAAMDDRTQGASLCSAVEKCPLVVDHPDGGNQSPEPSLSLLQSSAQEASECLRDDQGHISFDPNRDVQTLSVSENVVYSNKLELGINPDPFVTDMPAEKTACNFTANSTFDGLVDPVAVEYSKQDDEACENSTLQNSCFTENASFALQNTLASHSMEVQLSEAVNYDEDASCSPYEKCMFLDLHCIKNDQDALVNSRENGMCGNNLPMCGNNLPMCSEERELSNNANGRENSVCSQVDQSYAKSCLKSATTESNPGCYRQVSLVNNKSENSGSRYEPRVLRSTMRSNKVHPRRSMRLVTKQT